ncbi:hypothetical protein LSAT2_023964 [Lamellibrachia satsuma]|nr:hypothetical protein LSAT2_023964 [Lamellibrachia satsuma]
MSSSVPSSASGRRDTSVARLRDLVRSVRKTGTTPTPHPASTWWFAVRHLAAPQINDRRSVIEFAELNQLKRARRSLILMKHAVDPECRRFGELLESTDDYIIIYCSALSRVTYARGRYLRIGAPFVFR